MGRHKARQGDLMIGWAELPRSPGHADRSAPPGLLSWRQHLFNALLCGLCGLALQGMWKGQAPQWRDFSPGYSVDIAWLLSSKSADEPIGSKLPLHLERQPTVIANLNITVVSQSHRCSPSFSWPAVPLRLLSGGIYGARTAGIVPSPSAVAVPADRPL
jgi:hypothetical protein